MSCPDEYEMESQNVCSPSCVRLFIIIIISVTSVCVMYVGQADLIEERRAARQRNASSLIVGCTVAVITRDCVSITSRCVMEKGLLSCSILLSRQ